MIHKLRVSSFTTTVLQFVHRPETGTISGRSAKYTQTLLEKGFKKTKHTHTHAYARRNKMLLHQSTAADQSRPRRVPAGAITKWEWLVWIWLMPVLLLLGVQEKHVPSAQSQGLTQIHTHIYWARMHTHIGLCLHYWFFSITLCSGLSHTHAHTHRDTNSLH